MSGDSAGPGMKCAECGSEVSAMMSECRVCGFLLSRSAATSPDATDTTARERKRYSEPAEAGDRLPTPARATRVDKVRGIARTVGLRQEGSGDKLENVLTFRVERHTEDGHPLPTVPVEMRALSLHGLINDGDEVVIHKSWKVGRTLKPARVQNLATGGWVKARGRMHTLAVVELIVLLVIVAVILIFVGRLVSGLLSLLSRFLS